MPQLDVAHEPSIKDVAEPALVMLLDALVLALL